MVADPPLTPTIQHLTKLVSEIGVRPVGSDANHHAAGYIAAAFQALGMMPEMLRFDAPMWRHLSTHVTSSGQTIPAHANTFSPPCDVNAPLVAAGTMAELSGLLITGRVLLLYGALIRQPLVNAHDLTCLPDDQVRLYDLLLRGKPAAVLFVTPRRGESTSMLEDADTDIPSASITPENALTLISCVGSPVHVQIDALRTWGYGDHVIARQPGRGKNVIVLAAHFDSPYDSPGASDTAGAMAAMLGVADRLLGRWMNVWVEYAAFNNKAYYGSSAALNQCYDRYLSQHGDMQSIVAALHLDQIGQILGTHTLSLNAHSAAFSGLTDGIAQTFPRAERIDGNCGWASSLYAARAVPTLTISTYSADALLRTPYDTLDWISAARIDETVTFVVRLIEALADKSPGWTRDGTPHEG